jgi:gamma-glutamyltranspeptidase/glutathione hydrolase
VERTALGDPAFVTGIEEYEKSMLDAFTAEEIRGKISDFHTLNVSVYDPALIESLDT